MKETGQVTTCFLAFSRPLPPPATFSSNFIYLKVREGECERARASQFILARAEAGETQEPGASLSSSLRVSGGQVCEPCAAAFCRASAGAGLEEEQLRLERCLYGSLKLQVAV